MAAVAEAVLDVPVLQPFTTVYNSFTTFYKQNRIVHNSLPCYKDEAPTSTKVEPFTPCRRPVPAPGCVAASLRKEPRPQDDRLRTELSEAKRNIDSLRKTTVAMAKKFSIFEAKAAESQNKNRERERELEATIAKQKKELAALRRERPKHRAQIKAVAAAIAVAPPTAAPVAKKRACTVPQRSQKMPKTSASER